MIKKTVPGQINLQDLKPIVEGSRILFPISASSEYVQEDGLSFGYPVDYGWVTAIEYDFTTGVLTEDTISLVKSLKKPTPPPSGICPIEPYDFSEDQLNAWKIGLDDSWAEERYREWLDEGLLDEGETKEQFIASELECYHSWPEEWRLAYDSTRNALNAPAGERQTIIVNEPLTLYRDSHGDYFFSTKHHLHGAITKADTAAAIDYIEEFKVYEEALKEYSRKVNKLAKNLELLKGTLS